MDYLTIIGGAVGAVLGGAIMSYIRHKRFMRKLNKVQQELEQAKRKLQRIKQELGR